MLASSWAWAPRSVSLACGHRSLRGASAGLGTTRVFWRGHSAQPGQQRGLPGVSRSKQDPTVPCAVPVCLSQAARSQAPGSWSPLHRPPSTGGGSQAPTHSVSSGDLGACGMPGSLWSQLALGHLVRGAQEGVQAGRGADLLGAHWCPGSRLSLRPHPTARLGHLCSRTLVTRLGAGFSHQVVSLRTPS